jgi:hypothetical protein
VIVGVQQQNLMFRNANPIDRAIRLDALDRGGGDLFQSVSVEPLPQLVMLGERVVGGIRPAP